MPIGHRGRSAKSSHWPGHPALYWRKDLVTVRDVPGIWRVYSPAENAGTYYLEPEEKLSEDFALTLAYGMLVSSDSEMVRWTHSQKEKQNERHSV